MSALRALALFVPGIHLGPMRLSVYGIAAALGVLTAMLLTGAVARRLALSPEAAWDTGLFAVIACFAASRVLLILSDPVAFIHYPFVVLSLPSLTFGGMALAGVAVAIYLRLRRLPVLRLLDAFAPGGAVLAAFLELGHWLDGSEPGMPVRSLQTPHTLPLLWPVSLLGIIASLALAMVLLGVLRRSSPAGVAAGVAITLGGLLAFALDLLSIPDDPFSTVPLEPGQIVALAAMLAGVLVWMGGRRADPSRFPAPPETRPCLPKT